MNEKVSPKMSLLEKLSYGAGNMGICLMTTVVTVFAMYFYTDVVGISVIQAGSIIAIGGIVDAVSDALMGVIVDRTKSKWGKCRPYFLFCALPLAISTFLVFHVPEASPAVKYIWCLVTYQIYTLAYTAVLIPQNVLITAITNDEADRLSTNMFGSLGTNFGQLIPNALALTLISFFGKGSEYRGFNWTIVIFGFIGMFLILMDGFNTRERMNMGKAAEVKISAKDTLRSMANLPWIICTVSMLLVIAQIVIKSSTTVYYATNVLNNPGMASTLLSITNIVGIPVTLVIPLIAQKIGNRNLVWCGCILGILGNAGMLVFKNSSFMLITCTVILSVGTAFINGIIYVMCAQSIDYGEWKMGIRVQGFLMAFIGFAVKIANSFVATVSSSILDAGGYVGGAETQTASAISAIETCYVWIPIIAFAIIFIINAFFKLDQQYPAIKAELDRRHSEAEAQ
ncbi:MAG: glycoside-pentoside-hexuronide (GPH):cation symporter [Erysipelotrichaceae bacterium]|nr:glycoside-pentoside-hexuronide (GPH):cation symporter [Erysipelotrichaceae bacterium]